MDNGKIEFSGAPPIIVQGPDVRCDWIRLTNSPLASVNNVRVGAVGTSNAHGTNIPAGGYIELERANLNTLEFASDSSSNVIEWIKINK